MNPVSPNTQLPTVPTALFRFQKQWKGEGHFQSGIPNSEFSNAVGALDNDFWTCHFPEQQQQQQNKTIFTFKTSNYY